MSMVMPAVLQRLMRHSEIGTKMEHYVTMDADTVARHATIETQTGQLQPGMCRSLPYRATSRLYPEPLGNGYFRARIRT